jgi:hypothetical protein
MRDSRCCGLAPLTPFKSTPPGQPVSQSTDAITISRVRQPREQGSVPGDRPSPKIRDELARDVTFTADITINQAAVRYLAHAEQYYVKNGRVTNQHRMIRLALRVARHRYGELEAREFGPRALPRRHRSRQRRHDVSRNRPLSRPDIVDVLSLG